MKVKELIAYLESCDQEAEVLLIDGATMTCPYEPVFKVKSIPNGVLIY